MGINSMNKEKELIDDIISVIRRNGNSISISKAKNADGDMEIEVSNHFPPFYFLITRDGDNETYSLYSQSSITGLPYRDSNNELYRLWNFLMEKLDRFREVQSIFNRLTKVNS